MNTAQQFIDLLIDDIAKNKLEVPVLPEVALRVRKLIDDPHVSSTKVAQVISTDAALTSRLLQVANSAMFTGIQAVDNVRAAINRLGLALVRNMVVCIVMKILYTPKMSPVIKQRMQTLWKHSTKVAAFSHALAKKYPHLRRDEAMLAGLLHDIGTLPILTRATKYPAITTNPALLQEVIDKMHTEIGRLILQAWNFPPELVNVASEHEDTNRINLGPVDYVDIVTVANLHSYLGTDHRLAKEDWSMMPAFNRLNLTPADSVRILKDAQTEILAVYQLLGG